MTVTGLPAQVNVLNTEAANDRLIVNGCGGNDTISASGADHTRLLSLTIDGGAGDDTITGGRFARHAASAATATTIDRWARRNDVAFLGANDDRFIWNPGDGSDVVEGQDGATRSIFNGSNANENLQPVRQRRPVVFSRDVGNILMDMDDVESLQLQGLDGTNTLTIGDLSGTDMTGDDFLYRRHRRRHYRRGRCHQQRSSPRVAAAPMSSPPARHRHAVRRCR